MAGKKTTDIEGAESAVTTSAQGVPAGVQSVPAPLFRDKVFTSRTLILPDGSVEQVAKGQIAAGTPELLEFLKARDDFEPAPE